MAVVNGRKVPRESQRLLSAPVGVVILLAVSSSVLACGSKISNGTMASGGSGQAAGTGANAGGGSAGRDTAGGASNPEAGAPVGGDGSSTETLGAPCSPAGALGCNGAHQKLPLICGAQGTWEARAACGSGEFCNSNDVADHGICGLEAPECAGLEPGTTVCVQSQRRACGVDALDSSLLEDCAFGCEDGMCAACPSPFRGVDCTLECDQSKAASCVPDGCQIGRWEGWFFEGWLIRVPTPPSLCDCAGHPAVAWFHLGIGEQLTPHGTYHAIAPASWFWADRVGDCELTGDRSCQEFVVEDGKNPEGYLATRDANAPVANTTIEAGPCPP